MTTLCQRGVLVGCDEAQEWLLSWWWNHYRETNDFPVAFVDFGMREASKKWCRERGLFIPLSIPGYKVATQQQIDPCQVQKWEQCISPFWESRQAWFKKPFGMLQTPFLQTIWMDLDCEILGPLEPIFNYIDPQSKMGLVKIREAGEMAIYNSGVITFEKESPLLAKWATRAFFQNDQYLSDQDALCALIHEESIAVGELPDIYNWIMCRGIDLRAVVLHWAAVWGKQYIKNHGGLKTRLRLLK